MGILAMAELRFTCANKKYKYTTLADMNEPGVEFYVFPGGTNVQGTS